MWNLPPSFIVLLTSSFVFIRSLIGFHPHSGQDDNHGNLAAYGGDFEAQRHWMEITFHLPISSWYHYDLEFWGLDYPPLTAYVSYICGYLSHIFVGPDSVALYESRGLEDPLHKAFMRATVIALDMIIYFPVVWIISHRCYHNHSVLFVFSVIFSMIQPALLLIDHGHFQYNSVALGLSLWSFHFMTKQSFHNCIFGSFLFCMSLNFKQMTLYYAPVVFCYLLGRCMSTQNKYQFVSRFLYLGFTVLFSFGILWWPFFLYPYKNDTKQLTSIQSALHVLRRLFPFQRGLFEGKVSNLWCALSTKPFSIRTRIPTHIQPILALILTLILLILSCMKIFQSGLKYEDESSTKKIKKNKLENQHLKLLLWSTSASALSFFLASFQVHEKSILMALSPLSLLFVNNPFFVSWFSIISTWTLWPLLTIDRLRLPYIYMHIIFLTFLWIFWIWSPKEKQRSIGTISLLTNKIVYPLSIIFMITLHGLELFYEPPKTLPDLFPVLWNIVGCGLFCWSWIFSCYSIIQEFNDLISVMKIIEKKDV